MIRSWLVVVALLGGGGGEARAAGARASGLCAAVRRFEAAPLARGADGKERPRSVELLWFDVWGMLDSMGAECRHHGDPVGKALCNTLMPPPQEFRKSLPFSIMGCFGYRFPAYVGYNWDRWDAEIRLGSKTFPRMRLDVYMVNERGIRDALRLTVFPIDYDEVWGKPLPSLREPIPPPEAPAEPAATKPPGG
jgi:hypothetical protein